MSEIKEDKRMKVLDIEYTNLTDMKKSPSKAFEKAKETNTGVYVFRNSKPYGVVLTSEQYEGLNREIENLQDRLDELTISERLTDPNVKTYTEKEVLGDRLDNVTYDDDDGWE